MARNFLLLLIIFLAQGRHGWNSDIRQRGSKGRLGGYHGGAPEESSMGWTRESSVEEVYS